MMSLSLDLLGYFPLSIVLFILVAHHIDVVG